MQPVMGASFPVKLAQQPVFTQGQSARLLQGAPFLAMGYVAGSDALLLENSKQGGQKW